MLKTILLLVILSILLNTPGTEAQLSKPCVLNGVTYRYGEKTVEMQANGMLYTCTCILLFNDRVQRRCNSSAPDAHLILSDVTSIRKFALGDARAFEKPYIKNLPKIAVSVDVDLKNDYIYWTDVSFNMTGIYRARFSDGDMMGYGGRRIEKIVSTEVAEPNGVAVDWLSDHIYWTDAQLGAIYVSQNDGRNRARIIGGLPAPRGIALVPTIGEMFWTDPGRGTIERARMDGTNHKIIFSNLLSPNEIVVSILNRHIFWIDGESHKIERCDFDGSFSSYKKIYDFTESGSPAAYGLAIFENRLYFALWDKRKIYSVTLEGSDWNVASTGIGTRPMGLSIVNQQLQTYGRLSNPCWSENSCSHLCLPKSHVAYRCACPSNSGLVLSSDQRTCKVPEKFILCTSLDEGTVMIFSMDEFSDRHPVVLVQADQPTAVDFDPVDRMVYWSDIGMNGIYRKPLSSKQPELFMRDGIENVEGMAIDAINRHLYFTNVGWEGDGKWFHRIELIELDEPHKRKILTTKGFDKPRDVTIDVPAGFLYVSDWGKNPKIVRLDLDGKNPYELPLVVENPNGIVSVGKNFYFTDSHYNSADRTENGTMIFNQFARVARYNHKQEDFEEIETVTSEIPFGLTYGNGRLFMTDWGLGAIYEIDVVYSKKPKGSRELAVGINKPTGIKYATLEIPKTEDEEEEVEGICERDESSMCSQICVPVGEEEFTCVCSDFGVTVLSDNQHRCVEADEFVLVADRVRILMRSLRPNDENSYIVVGGHDILSNIIAVTYDPVNKLIYWADSGRKRIGRKFLGGNSDGSIQTEQTIYTDISLVEGMALDSQQQLLYWTDAVKGTIEVLDVSTPAFKHAVILSNLQSPRGITLNTKQGLMYWTEVGLHPGVFEAGMNGQNSRQIINGGLTIPNGIFFNSTTNLFWVCDGNNVNVQSYASQGDGSVLDLDYSDFHGIASHIYAVAEMGNNFIISDWKQQSVILVKDFETEILIDDLYRPSQLHLQRLFTFTGSSTICFEDTCSHICVPDGSSFACVCPEHLVLNSDLRTCITEERANRMNETYESTTYSNINTTTFPWADMTTPVTTQAITTENTTTIQTTTSEQTTIQLTTIQETTETQTTTTATTTPPGPPYFTSCGGEIYKFVLPKTKSKVGVTADQMKIYAYDGHGTKLPVKVKGIETTSIELGASRQTHKLILYAMDAYGRIIQCQVDVRVLDRTPPRVVECPQDMNIDSFHTDEIAYVTWKTPKFVDNSGLELRILSSKTPGFFSRGIHNITYTAMDLDENKITCSFLISITKMDNICGEPYQPPNSRLMCTSSNRRGADIRQTCNVTCTDDHFLTLADPQVQCLGADDIWLPHLHDRVCQKPITGNVQQKVHFKYPCPCMDSTTFYEQSLEALAAKVKTEAECSTRKPKLGLCKDAKNKLSLNCQEDTLEVIVTVDLASSKDVKTTEEARNVVRRSASELMRMFTSGEIQAEGSDKKMYVAKAFSEFTDFEVICPAGHINNTKGCIPCPPGTYLENNKCVFCPLHFYQAREAQSFCYECAKHKGTTLRGSQHISNCKPMERVRISATDDNLLYIIIPIVGGVFLLLATCFIIFFVVRRRKNNKIKKKREEELKRKKQEIIEMRQLRKSVRNRSQRRSRRSQRRPVVHENRPATTNAEQVRQAAAAAPTPKPQKKRAAPGVEEAKKTQQQQQQQQTANKEKIDERSNDDRESNVSRQSSKVTHDWDDEKSVGAESAIFTDMTTGSETGSGTSTYATATETKQPQQKRALKSALKKPAAQPTRVLSDDETTVISVTSLDRGQLQQLHKRTRSNSLDRDRTRGRGGRRKGIDDDVTGEDISRTSSIRSILKKDRGDVRNRQYASFTRGTLPSRSLSQVSNSTYGSTVRPPRGPGPMGMRLPRMPRSRSDYGMRPIYPPGMGPGRMRMHGPRPVADRYPPPPPSDLSVDHHPRYPGYWGGPPDPSVRFRSLPPRMRMPPRYPPPMANGIRMRNPSQPPRYLPPLHHRYY